jgi:AcrR family transcriptional regulator
MARKSTRKQATGSEATGGSTARERIIEAFMALLAEKPFEQIGLGEIATGAEVSLAALRTEFASPFAILAAHAKAVDRAVLEGVDDEMTEEPPRERLFDVLMRRLEVLESQKAAVRSLLRSAIRNPGLALALNGLAVRSQQWMLASAGISATGPKGTVRAQGLAVLFGSVLRTWVDDDDPGHARTMAALDRALGRGQRCSALLDGVCSIAERICRGRPRRPHSDPGKGEAAPLNR